MKSRQIVFALVLVCAGAFLLYSATARSHRSARSGQPGTTIKVGFEIGELAPDFDLPSVEGGRLRLSDLRGKPLLLNFWATWCAPCRVEMPWLVELDGKYRALGLEIVGVSMDDAGASKEVAAFIKERGVKYKVALGNSGTADVYGGARFMPQSFFIDAGGKITKATTGMTDKRDLEDSVKALLACQGRPKLAHGGQP